VRHYFRDANVSGGLQQFTNLGILLQHSETFIEPLRRYWQAAFRWWHGFWGRLWLGLVRFALCILLPYRILESKCIRHAFKECCLRQLAGAALVFVAQHAAILFF